MSEAPKSNLKIPIPITRESELVATIPLTPEMYAALKDAALREFLADLREVEGFTSLAGILALLQNCTWAAVDLKQLVEEGHFNQEVDLEDLLNNTNASKYIVRMHMEGLQEELKGRSDGTVKDLLKLQVAALQDLL